jgi:hypothetical protein
MLVLDAFQGHLTEKAKTPASDLNTDVVAIPEIYRVLMG